VLTRCPAQALLRGLHDGRLQRLVLFTGGLSAAEWATPASFELRLRDALA
jgi:hypothetical protein